MSKQTRWTTIRKNLSKVLHISPDVLDFLADYDIMLQSVSGTSNKDIGESLDIDEKEIRKTILNNIGIYCDNWSGFTESSLINPYFVFRSMLKNLKRVPAQEEFIGELQRLTGDASFLGEDYEKIYRIVSIFSTVRYKYLSKYRKEDYGNYINRNSKKVTRL